MSRPLHWHLIEDYAFVDLVGPESGQFLQAQVTCDMQGITPGKSSLGSHCNPKGRMISSFRVAAINENHFRLRLHKSILEPARDAFGKYIVFSRSEISQDEHLSCIALSGDKAREKAESIMDGSFSGRNSSVIKGNSVGIQVDAAGSQFELWLDNPLADQAREELGNDGPPSDPEEWFLDRVRAGIGEVRIETSEMFIPQMLNLQSVGGISFSKGCYTGQEVVARMKYLGKLKRRMYRCTTQIRQKPQPGTPVFSPGKEQSVGNVVMAGNGDMQNVELLAVITTELVEMRSPLKLGAFDGPELTLLSLPYEVEA